MEENPIHVVHVMERTLPRFLLTHSLATIAASGKEHARLCLGPRPVWLHLSYPFICFSPADCGFEFHELVDIPLVSIVADRCVISNKLADDVAEVEPCLCCMQRRYAVLIF